MMGLNRHQRRFNQLLPWSEVPTTSEGSQWMSEPRLTIHRSKKKKHRQCHARNVYDSLVKANEPLGGRAVLSNAGRQRGTLVFALLPNESSTRWHYAYCLGHRSSGPLCLTNSGWRSGALGRAHSPLVPVQVQDGRTRIIPVKLEGSHGV